MKLHLLPALQWMAVVAVAATLSACDRGTPMDAVTPVSERVVIDTSSVDPLKVPALTSAALQQYRGMYPSDGATSFLEHGTLADRLKVLLGDVDYKVLLDNMDVASPLEKDGERFFITGNRMEQGGEEMAAVVADPTQNAVRVWLVNQGKSQTFQDPEQVDVPWPADVQTMMRNYQAAHSK